MNILMVYNILFPQSLGYVGAAAYPTFTAMYINGGNDPTQRDTTQQYDPDTYTGKTASSSTWDYHVGGGIGGDVYLHAGRYNGTSSVNNITEMYSVSGNSWTSKAANSPDKYGHGGDSNYVDKMWVTGGSGASNDNDEYAPNSWTAKTNNLADWSWSQYTFMQDKMYYHGGYSGSQTDNNDEYDPSGNSWSNKTAISLGTTHHHRSHQVLGDLYLHGGRTGATQQEWTAQYTTGDSWTAKADSGQVREMHVVMEVDNKLYTTQGHTGSVYLTSTLEYDTAGNSWSSKATSGGNERISGCGGA